MKASKLLEQIQSTIKMNNEMVEELIQESRLWESERDEDPNVYISIGPSCIPITAQIESVSTVMGSINGLCLSAKIDNLPPELSQRWFDLQQEIMSHMRNKNEELLSRDEA